MTPRQKLLLGLGLTGAVAAVFFWRRKQVTEEVLGVASKIQAAAADVVRTLLGVTDSAKWAASLYGVISRELPQLSPKARVLMVAHAAYESGWGQKAAAARGSNNIWNLTAGSAWTGQIDFQPDADLSYNVSECSRLGRPVTTQSNGKPACRIDQRWRKYPSVNEAVRDYWSFLGPQQNGGRYIKARAALEAGDTVGFARELAAVGYYTLPSAEYAKKLGEVVESVQRRLLV